jgi:hypothetical protein
MALTVWTQRSGYRFSTIQERSIVNLLLPSNNSVEIDYSVISGRLPPGLRIVNNTIQGSPFEVPRTTDFEFVIRASNGTQIADRTFFWTVEGADEPTWSTPEGSFSN